MKRLFAWWTMMCVMSAMTAVAQNHQGHSHAKVKRSDANIVGHVIDAASEQHVPFVNVVLKGTTIGTTTDESGHYFLKNLPEGNFTIEVATLGYKTETREVVTRKGKTLEENFTITEDLIALDGVVVSANRNETSRRLAPTLINVIDMRLFETTTSPTLAEGLNFQPGVRVENNCQNCGFQQVRINGLEGPYTQILIDSRPIFSALSGVYGLEQIPANMVERVEVMRGGGSALFGSSAIAGTINIITKEPLRNSGQLAHTTMSIDGAMDHSTTLNASLVTDNRKAGLFIFGQNRQREAYDANGDDYSELCQLHQQTVGFRSYVKTSMYSKLSFEYHHIEEFRRGGDSLDLPPHQANIAEQTEHSINGGGLKFDYFSPNEKHHLSLYASAQHIDRQSYYGAGRDPNAYGATTDLTTVVGGQYVYNFDRCLFMPATFTGGVEYNRDALEDNMWGYGRELKQTVHISSAFLQNEWKNDHWSFLVGGRFDKHNLIDGLIFSPRATMRFNPTENVNLRASYSAGFRAPQAFDEDLHIEAVGGGVSMIELAGDLQEEKSHSFSLSADLYQRWGAFQGNLLVEAFYTTLNDVFALREKSHENGILTLERHNASGADVYGMTIEGKLAYLNKVQLQAGATLQKSEYKQPEQWSETAKAEKRIARTPEAYGYFTLSYNPIKPLTASFSGTYTGSMLMQHVAGYVPEDIAVETPDFFDLNFKLSYDFDLGGGSALQLNAGVQNIFNAYQTDFDKGELRDAGYMYGPGLPRSFFAGAKLDF